MKKELRLKVSTIPVIAFLMALEIILTRFMSINTPIVRIGFGFIPVALVAIMYGPLWAAASYALGDIIGATLFPTAGYFPGFTLTAFLTGLTFGFFLHDKKVNWKTVLPSSLIVCFLLNLGMDTLWLYIIMGDGVWAMIPMRIVKAAVMIPIHVILIPFVWNRLGSQISKRS